MLDLICVWNVSAQLSSSFTQQSFKLENYSDEKERSVRFHLAAAPKPELCV